MLVDKLTSNRADARAVSNGELPAQICDTDATLALKRRQCRNQAKLFVKGPIPLSWIRKCRTCHSEALALALIIRMFSDMKGGQPVIVSDKASKMLGIGTDTRRRALAALEKAGLVRVVRQPGRAPLVSLKS